MEAFDAIGALRIGLASPEHIRSWSRGEVSQPETINYRTQKPEKDGLFCERIFGPTRDWSCACGKYQRKRQPGFVCEKCGVELAPACIRRERLGHIELAVPVVHPWYLRSRAIGLLLDLSLRKISAVLAYQYYLVLMIDEHMREKELAQQAITPTSDTDCSPLLASLQPGDLIDGNQYQTLSARFAGMVQAKAGAEAIHARLCALDLDQLAGLLHEEIERSGKDQKKAIRRLQVVESFRSSGQNPAWMVLSVLPVLPPELRPLVPLDGGRFASSDVNDLYCRVIHRNNRLKRLLARGAPEIILNNECRLLQEACHALFDNAHSKKPQIGARRHPLKSLTDHIQGKEGLFRRNLLGKRVDYSGRSVIVVGPHLKLHQCGLPKEMALELFKPFVMKTLVERGYTGNIKTAKRMIDKMRPEVWDALEEVIREHPVLLNRAPTLHRLGIQAFEPVLVDGKAIQVHPD